MEKITSFTIDHNVLKKGLYLSRVDKNVFTYDLRFKEPNKGDYLHIAAMHTIEHLLQPSCETVSIRTRLYISAQWDVARAFIFCFLTLTNKPRSKSSKYALRNVSNSIRYPATKKSNAETIALTTLKAQRKNLPHILTCSTP